MSSGSIWCRDVASRASTKMRTAASVAALTLYDMTKARCRAAVIDGLRLLHKSGGKTGTFDRAAAR